MSFQNYEAFQNQPGQPEQMTGGNGVPQVGDGTMVGQPMDPSSAAFSGQSAGSGMGQPGDDMKTTLWSVPRSSVGSGTRLAGFSPPRSIIVPHQTSSNFSNIYTDYQQDGRTRAMD